VDVPGWLDSQLAQANPDLLRAMLKTFAEALMSAEADAVCGAAYSQRSPERVNSRNGYRHQDWDIRAGTVELEIPSSLCALSMLSCDSGGCGSSGRRAAPMTGGWWRASKLLAWGGSSRPHAMGWHPRSWPRLAASAVWRNLGLPRSDGQG
jgi:hypothetical protein